MYFKILNREMITKMGNKHCLYWSSFSNEDNILKFCTGDDLFIAEVEIPNTVTFYNFNSYDKRVASKLIVNELHELYHIDTLKWMIKNGVNINVNDDLYFRSACEYGYLHTVKYLIDNCNVDISAKDNYAIKKAVSNARLATTKLLFSYGIPLNIDDNYLLIEAVKRDYYFICEYLINNKIDIHFNDEEALIESIKNNKYSVCKLLIENGADIHARKELPLRIAIHNNNYKIVKLLLESCDYNTLDNSILQYALTISKDKKIINLLKVYVK